MVEPTSSVAAVDTGMNRAALNLGPTLLDILQTSAFLGGGLLFPLETHGGDAPRESPRGSRPRTSEAPTNTNRARSVGRSVLEQELEPELEPQRS